MFVILCDIFLGRVLFPATGYLYLVWQLFAEIQRKTLENCDVEFKNVKFHRATPLNKSQENVLRVVILKGSGKFEISEGNNLLVSGFVAVPDKKLTSLDDFDDKKCPILQTEDFYKELRLRGYNYSGLFKSVIEAKSNGQGGKIKWSSNWIAFLDCLFQMPTISMDTRSLLVATSLRKIVIKPKEHLKIIKAIKADEKILSVKSCKDLDVLRCGGIEIRGSKASKINRKNPPGIPVLESHEFVPHFTTTPISHSNFAQFCVQLAFENNPIPNFCVVEIDGNDGKEPLCELFAQAFEDTPLTSGELTYLTSKSLGLDKINVIDSEVQSINNINLIIVSDLLSNNKMLESITTQLADGAFIVSREKISSNKKLEGNFPNGFQIIAMIPSEIELNVVLQFSKTRQSILEKFVKISSKNFDWIEELKDAILAGPVLAYSEKEDFSGILGLVKCIRKEINGLNLKCFFIDDNQAPVFNAQNGFFKSQLEKGLTFNVYKNGQWGSYRHFKLQKNIISGARTDHCFANCLTRGDLSSLTWLEGPLNHKKTNKNLVKVQYAALNFKDVMLATGKLSADLLGAGRLDQLCVFGVEFAGVDSNNQRVMGMLPHGAMATQVEADEAVLWNVPDDWKLEEAATVPCVYGTVYSAFFLTANIEKGKSILIHAGSGGIGLAAIQVAFAYGLKVFTTVSTEEKQNFLLDQFPKLKSENIGNSRDTSFEDLIMKRTKGKGVDYVLNSLAEDKLQASIRCLGIGGKFMEIGKFDMENDTNIGLRHFLRKLSFHSIVLEMLFGASVEEKLKLKNIIEKDLKRGIIKPIKTNVFIVSEIEQAFRFLAGGKHIGKVILKVRENENDSASLSISVVRQVYCNPKLSYIIPGGLGGFGLELADWLVLRGCRKLVMSSSRGITSGYQAYRIRSWESYGVQVNVNTSDITTKSGCEQLIRDAMNLGPVGGIFNLAAKLCDAMFENQNVEKFTESFATKAIATKHLDELSRQLCPELHLFVIFSSTSCSRGNASQSNYGMSNSVMERIIERRHNLGLPAKAIQWGSIGDVGLVANMMQNKSELEIAGTLPQRISSCLEELDLLLTVAQPVVGSMVVAKKRYETSSKVNVLDSIMRIMSIRDAKSISMETTLSELGMDSMMTTEIQQTFNRDFDFIVTHQELRLMKLSQILICANDQKLIGKAEDIKMIEKPLETVAEETFCDQILLKLESLSENGVKTLIVPAIEGLVAKIWYNIVSKIDGPVYFLQTFKTWSSSDINEIFDFVIQHVIDIFAGDDKFMIIGYSFGALLSLKIAKVLEDLGKTGKVLLLDGSPKFLKTLVSHLFPENYTELSIKTFAISIIISYVYPKTYGEVMKKIMAETSLDLQIMKAVEFVLKQKFYSEEFLISLMSSLVNRMKIQLEIDFKDYPKLEKTSLILVKASEASVRSIEEDYGLRSHSSKPVDVKVVSASHANMLDNPKIVEIFHSLRTF